jgi:hypothetical protein
VTGIRVVVVDDNPHLAWAGRVHPVNATFHRFLAAILDVPHSPVAEIVHVVPLREALGEPHSLAVDARIRTVGSAPFDGIAGFLRHARSVTRRNRPIFEREIGTADLVWLKVPASNAALTASVAGRLGVERFGWVAGSARQVAAGLPRNPVVKAASMGVGAAYDAIGRVAGGPRRVVVGRGIVDGDGIVSSLVEPAELVDATLEHWQPRRPARLAWAGRVAEGKGLTSLVDALVVLKDAELVVLGDGPARQAIEALARRRRVAERVEWRGHVAGRADYLDALRAADLLIHPSPAEGFPKVVLDAMAVGLPVAAFPAGGIGELGRARLVKPIGRGRRADPTAAAVLELVRDPLGTQAMRERASVFAAAHTAPAEAARLIARLRGWFPDLPWD